MVLFRYLSSMFTSSRPFAILLGRLLIALLILNGLIALSKPIESLSIQYMYQKDYVQEYLMARAILSREKPYLPLPELGGLFLPSYSSTLFPHPSPHPPLAALLAAPFGLLPYEQSQALWFFFEITCLAVSCWLLATMWGSHIKFAQTLPIVIVALPFLHIWEELSLGQLMIPLLLLLIGAWRALRGGRDLAGGMLLGLAIALKLIIWPIIILLVMRSQWRAAFASCFSVAFVNLAGIVLIGPREVAYYYLVVGKAVWSFYKAQEGNISLSSVGWRLFDGTGSPVISQLHAPPLIAFSNFAGIASFSIVAIWLILGLAMAKKARSLDVAFSMMICVCILASPIAWCHYLVLLAIPFTVMVHEIIVREATPSHIWLLLLTFAFLSIPATDFHAAIVKVTPMIQSINGSPTASFAASLIYLTPTAVVILLLLQICKIDRGPISHVSVSDNSKIKAVGASQAIKNHSL
jgi:Glycosyltransferase family 87